MKNQKLLLPLLGGLVLVSFCSLILIVYPAFDSHFDFSSDKTANIGGTIGGVVGPIVGIFSTVLLFVTFSSQREANKDQRAKADMDVIFLLLNQLDKEYDSFNKTHIGSSSSREVYGVDAVALYAKEVKSSVAEHNFKLFKEHLSTLKFVYLMDSFSEINKRFQVSKFDGEDKSMMTKKLMGYYNLKFKIPIENILLAISEINDPLVDNFIDFQKHNSLVD